MKFMYDGGFINLENDGSGFYDLQSRGMWEWRKAAYMKQYLRPGMTFVDAGAYNGYFTLLAANYVGVRGRVYAFEPNHDNYNILMDNIGLNHYPQVYALRVALSDWDNESTPLYKRDHPGMSTLIRQNNDEPMAMVITRRLDSIFSTPIDMMKIDIEGAEAALLLGMKRIFDKSHPMTLLMDLHPEMGAKNQEVDRILKAAGFSLFDMRTDNQPIDVIPPTLVELLAVRR